MSSLEATTEPVPRSPSPVVPGAWPSSPPNSLRQGSKTFPALSSHSFLSANPLHLDHVRHFQKRLSQALSKTVERADAIVLVPRSADHLGLSDSISTPSNGSGLTRSTQLDTNSSLSMFEDTSMAPSCSTPAKGSVTFSRYENVEDSTQSTSASREPRICDASSDSISKIFPSTSGYNYAASPLAPLTFSTQVANNHPPRIDFPASLSRSSWSFHPSPDSVSPISFSSPTSSNNPLPRRRSCHEQGYCPSLEFSTSPSWETSFNTQIDFDPLRVESDPQFIWPEPMLNPSQSQPFNTFNLHNHNDSSTELEVPAVPMLTALSLPGSLDTTLDISRRNSPRHRHRQDNSPAQDSSLSSSPLSVSEVTGAADIRVLEFPSPPLTLSPFITAPPPESPIIDLAITDSSTVEYASAVVLSSWGPDISIRPDYPIANILPDVSSPSASETPRNAGFHHESAGGTRPSVMVTRFKTLGRKMKKFLSHFPNIKPEGSIPDRRPERSQDGLQNTHPSTSFNDIGDGWVEAGLRREDSSMRVEGNHSFPLPPGLPSCPTCPTQRRPVAPQMPPSNTVSSHRLPVIRITSSSCSYRTPITHIPDGHMNDLSPPEDSIRTLEIEARPKTLEEIKSKRRLSLSILSNTGCSVSQPSSSIVAVARTRQRPRSGIVLPAASSSSISGGDGSRSLSNTINDTLEDEIPIPETLSAQSTALKRGDIGLDKKKHRRFSLPVLSHFTKFAL